MPRPQDLNLEMLYARAARTFRHGGGSRPEVTLVALDGEQAVLKDFSRTDPAFHLALGRFSAWRETRALTLLDGVPGVPRLLARVGRDALLMEYLPGQSARELKRGALPPDFFERFYRLVESLHARGVAHCDLRSTGNILVLPDGEPAVVDFMAHFRRPRTWNPPMRWLYERFCEADRVAVARLKKTHVPELLTEAELAMLLRDRKTPLERAARWFGKSVRYLSRLLLTRGRPRA